MLDTAALPDAAAFAAANGLRHEASAPKPAHGGAVFEYLQSASVTDRFTSPDGTFEVGNLSGTVGGSQSSDTGGFTITTSYSSTAKRSYGYLAMRLERALPHLVLDATRNDRTFGSSIPMPIAGGQTLSLEGDFNNYFTLHCPNGYERDALYVFAPDLMALLIDATGDFDVEIVDDMLFVYSNTPFELSDAALWQRLDRIREVVGAKALRQTGRYSDDRVSTGTAAATQASTTGAPNVVGEDGRRLTQGFLGADPKKDPKRMLWIVGGVLVGVVVIIGAVGTIIVQAVLSMLGDAL